MSFVPLVRSDWLEGLLSHMPIRWLNGMCWVAEKVPSNLWLQEICKNSGSTSGFESILIVCDFEILILLYVEISMVRKSSWARVLLGILV